MKPLEQKDRVNRRQAKFVLTKKSVKALETDGYLQVEVRPDGQLGCGLTQAGLIAMFDDTEGSYGRLTHHD